jgi:alpha-N-arabinofuranosidase
MNAALGDAAWMTGMERNSDVVLMSCYAPLFVNVNPATKERGRAWQWDSDLIGYNAIRSYGSPSYYAQSMFNTYIGDHVVPISSENIPMKKAAKADSLASRNHLGKNEIPALYYVATRDNKSGAIYLKVVNTSGNPYNIAIDLKGAATVMRQGTQVVLKSDKPEDTNTIDEPEKIMPVTTSIGALGKSFKHSFAPYSITVIKLQTAVKK